jgi:hypothetical protein
MIQSINNKLLVGIITIIAVIIILLSVYYIFFNGAEEVIDEPEIIIQTDDRISPNVNQAVILEVLRIRNRDLLDIIMQPGNSWENKPKMFFITEMDDLEYISKNVGSASRGITETFINEWDSIFKENKIVRDAEEEQEISYITLKIMQRKNSGLFGRQTSDIELANIYLIYDYKTGRWSGDDYFNDTDGYGHYINNKVEVWFNLYQTDFDGDGIPYWTEVNILNTNPKVDDTLEDPDEDGIPTAWEWKWGYDPNVYDNHSMLDPDHDGIENTEEYFMEKWFADPYQPDIYIEIDGMESGGFLDPPHIFYEESQQILIERFTQHDINVYIDHGWPDGPVNRGGELLTHYERMSQDSGMMLQYYRNHFADERKGIFRYIVMCHRGGFCHPATFNRYDQMAVGISNQQMIAAKGAFTPRAYRIVAATSLMHELGHSLGVAPWNVGGCDNFTFAEGRAAKQEFLDDWGNYKSVMSYYYIYDKTIVDYSDGTHGPGDVSDWELFDLSAFQHDTNVIEDPGFELPGIEEISFMQTVLDHLPLYTGLRLGI